MEFRLAREDELEPIKRFYDELIDAMEDSEYGPRWKKDQYPDEEYIASSIKTESFTWLRMRAVTREPWL